MQSTAYLLYAFVQYYSSVYYKCSWGNCRSNLTWISTSELSFLLYFWTTPKINRQQKARPPNRCPFSTGWPYSFQMRGRKQAFSIHGRRGEEEEEEEEGTSGTFHRGIVQTLLTHQWGASLSHPVETTEHLQVSGPFSLPHNKGMLGFTRLLVISPFRRCEHPPVLSGMLGNSHIKSSGSVKKGNEV